MIDCRDTYKTFLPYRPKLQILSNNPITPISPLNVTNTRNLYHEGGAWATSDGYYDYVLGKIYSSPGTTYPLMHGVTTTLLNNHQVMNSGYLTYQATQNGSTNYPLWTGNAFSATSTLMSLVMIVKHSGDGNGGIMNTQPTASTNYDPTRSILWTYLNGIHNFYIGAQTQVLSTSFNEDITNNFQIVFIDVCANLPCYVNIYIKGNKYSISSSVYQISTLYIPSTINTSNVGVFGTILNSANQPSTINLPSQFSIFDIAGYVNLLTSNQKNQIGLYLSQRYNIPYYFLK